MPPPRAVLSWSSGKDCAFALVEARRLGLAEVVALLAATAERTGRVVMHGTGAALLRRQAEALGLPLIEVPLPSPCPDAVYAERMRAALDRAAEAGARAVVFGDICLEDVRAYREERLRAAGFAGIFPLWGQPTAGLAHRIVAAGIEARVVCLDPRRVPAHLAGRRYDRAFLEALPEGVDPCGENGEFHTAVLDAPGFAAPIRARKGRTVRRDGFVHAGLRLL